VPVALFSVITLALFSVIAVFANAAQWPCFRLSNGPLFGYHTQVPNTVRRYACFENRHYHCLLLCFRHIVQHRLTSCLLFAEMNGQQPVPRYLALGIGHALPDSQDPLSPNQAGRSDSDNRYR